MDGLQIKLFGGFQVWRDGKLIKSEDWGRQRARSLLKLLLTQPGHAFSRDEIMETLWPGASPKAAERSLWVTVSRLRRVLEPDLERGSDSRYVLQKSPGYLFDHQGDCEADAWRFEKHQSRAEAAHEAGNLDEAIREYRSALALLQGEFLAEEPYEDWAIKARQEWHKRHLDVLLNLSECLAQKGRYTEAIESCSQALALDEFGEDLHRRLMLYHYCAGEQARALKAYRDYARSLKEELGTAPSPDLTRLKERVEARDVPGVDEARRRYPRPRRPMKFPYSLGRTHFVGRDRELSLLTERLKETMEGRGGTVAVEGEVGVGKTRLVEEFVGHARSRGVRVLSGRCYERELAPPLEPVMEALGHATDIDRMISGAGHPGAEGSGYLRQAEPYDGSRIYRALTRELVRESRGEDHKGLILFVDDLQWADHTTMEFLSYLAKRVSSERLLLLVSYRREHATELSGWLERLVERRKITTLSLDRLSSENFAQIIRRMSSRGFGDNSSLAKFLHRESEGNPFYAVEYLRWLIESGIVRIDSRRRICELDDELPQGDTLPSGVRSLIQARLSNMGDGARELLELAAVIGRTFNLELLCKVAACTEPDAFDTIEPLVSSGLITEASEEMYHFSHDKLRQTLYGDVRGPRRRVLHLRVAQALEEADGERAELAHHYLRAKKWRPALENLMLAARRAEESYAWDATLQIYARALEVVDKLPKSEETKFELLASRERALEHMDRWEERAATVQQMLDLAKRLGDQGRIAEVHVRRIGALAAISDPTDAEEAEQAAIAIFQELEDKAGEARAHRELGYVYWMSRDYARALEESFQALGIHRELGDRRGEAGDALNITQVYRGMGDYDQALHWAEEAARIYGELGDEFYEEMRTYVMTTIHLDRGDLEAALQLSLEVVRSDIESGRKSEAARNHSRCGTLYLRLRRPEEALEHFRASARLNRETGYARDEGYSLMSVGTCLERTGDRAGAADSYRRAVELLELAYEESSLSEDLSTKADAMTLLARNLHHWLDRPEEALDIYGTAAETYRKLGDTGRLRRVLLRLAGLRWRMGNLRESALGYEETLQLAQEHGETPHEAAALASLSVVYRGLGRLKESLRCGRMARDLLRNELGDVQAEAYVLSSLAESYGRLGHHPSALSCLKRSLRLRQKVGDKEGEIGALYDLARIYEKLEDADRARDVLEEAGWKEEALKVDSGAKTRS